jgi:glycosyltransferase involved in cell wall biosynthesis
MVQEVTNPVPRKPRLMLFTDSFRHGGTERQFVRALQNLDRGKYDLLAGCLRREGPFLAEVQALGIPIVEFAITSLHSFSTLRWFAKLVSFLRREQVDLLHAFDFYTDIFAVPAARCAGVSAVLASRRNLAHHRSAPEIWALRVACALADEVVANSRAAASRVIGIRDSANGTVKVIYNGLNPLEYRLAAPREEIRERLQIAAGLLYVGVVAGLRREKGHRMFLKAAAQVAREHPTAQFVLIGDGSERAQLEALVRELGIAERVLFAGDCDHVAAWLAALDVFVLPSDFESLPNAVLEAMAAGLPVVATRVGGTPEIVEEGKTGFLVDVGDAEMMSRRILDLLRDPALRRAMGEAGCARVQREFTIEQMIERLEGLYDALLQKAAQPLVSANMPRREQ